jgi:hypothetical protein
MKNRKPNPNFDGICKRCIYRETCKKPCAPVYYEVQKQVKGYEDHHEKTVQIKRPDLEVASINDYDRHGRPLQELGECDSNRYKDSWEDMLARDHSKKLTGIFVDRFFHGWKFKDLAVKYDLSDYRSAAAFYSQAKQNLMEIVELLDKARHRRIKQMEQSSGRFTQKTKSFLLSKCFDMTCEEIAEYTGRSAATISKDILACAQRIREGKPVFIFDGDNQQGRSATVDEIRGRAKIDDYTIAQIRRLKAAGLNGVQIAEQVNISESAARKYMRLK